MTSMVPQTGHCTLAGVVVVRLEFSPAGTRYRDHRDYPRGKSVYIDDTHPLGHGGSRSQILPSSTLEKSITKARVRGHRCGSRWLWNPLPGKIAFNDRCGSDHRKPA